MKSSQSSINFNQEILMSQLMAAFETLREIYKTSLQFITIAAGAEVLLLSFGLQYKSAVMILLSGVVMIVLIYQLKLSGRTFSSIMITAFSLEQELGLSGRKSIVASFFGSILGVRKLEEFISDMALINGNRVESDWLNCANKYSPFKGGFTTTLAMSVGIVLIFVAIFLTFHGWS